VRYINDLTNWFELGCNYNYQMLTNLRKNIDEADVNLKAAQDNFNQDYVVLLESAAQADANRFNRDSFVNEQKRLRLSMAVYYPSTDYLSGENYVPAPSAPEAGEELGIFKPLVQWLLKPDSMALVLIVGMIGFGLFGATISTFVKEKVAKKNKHGYIITDITGVVVRGTSAAIVIFLAVKGGLSVFAQNNTDPNPYALFFTCLVGAVYSERIWEWAKQKMTETLAKSGEEGGEEPIVEPTPEPVPVADGDEAPAVG